MTIANNFITYDDVAVNETFILKLLSQIQSRNKNQSTQPVFMCGKIQWNKCEERNEKKT